MNLVSRDGNYCQPDNCSQMVSQLFNLCGQCKILCKVGRQEKDRMERMRPVRKAGVILWTHQRLAAVNEMEDETSLQSQHNETRTFQ